MPTSGKQRHQKFSSPLKKLTAGSRIPHRTGVPGLAIAGLQQIKEQA